MSLQSFQFLSLASVVACSLLSLPVLWACSYILSRQTFDEYLKYSFYPYDLVIFSSVFMLNKCPNALKVLSYDQVIHLVELCKIGGKTATKATGEAT